MIFLSCIVLMHCARQSDQTDEESVRKLVLDFQEDFNQGDFQLAEKYATDDWIHINPGGGVDIGKANVLKTVREVHQTFLKGVSITTDSMNISFLSPDVALAVVFHPISTYMAPDGSVHKNERHVKSYVAVKKNGMWSLAMDHNTIIGN